MNTERERERVRGGVYRSEQIDWESGGKASDGNLTLERRRQESSGRRRGKRRESVKFSTDEFYGDSSNPAFEATEATKLTALLSPNKVPRIEKQLCAQNMSKP